MNKRFFATAFTLTGTVIGAGVLGLPYVFSKAGFLTGLFWLVFLGLIMTFVNLCLGEISLRTNGINQLTGYAKKYLGRKGKVFMFVAFSIGVYFALTAYLIGEARSISVLIFGSEKYLILVGFLFWLLMTLLLREGLKGLKRTETWGVLGIVFLIILIFVIFSPQVDIENLAYNNFGNFLLPIGVVLFAYAGFASLPELRREIKGSEKKLMKAILVGSLIPVVLYLLFSLSVIGFLGKEVKEVATNSFSGSGIIGRVIVLLGIFTMFTSYFVLSFALKDMYKYDFKIQKLKLLPKTTNFFLVSFLPFLAFLLLELFNMAGFTNILGLGGAISNGLIGILAMLMLKQAKVKGKRKPEFTIPINWPIIIIVSIIFLGGILAEFLF